MKIKQKRGRAFQPDSIAAYFRLEWLPLTLITLSGLAYNVGLLAGPWFEGRLAQCLADILGGNETAAAMTALAAGYILVTLLVQAARFVKRFYVRRFANNINRRMKGVLYANLVRQSRGALEKQGAGELMTKAISDVDDCVEGSNQSGYEGQILVLKPEAYGSSMDLTADDSLWYARDGFGCIYGARGQAVYAENLLDGRYIHRERKDFYGIVKPESLAAWLSDKPIRSEVAEAVLEAAVQDLAPELEGEEEMEH